jgi:putative ABC transport system substrate-binding protein
MLGWDHMPPSIQSGNHCVKRRQFITLLGGAAVTWPIAVRGQQATAMPVVGFLGVRSAREAPHLLAAFHQGLARTGYVDGRNVSIEYRWAEAQYDRLPKLVADLIQHRPAVIAAPSLPATLAAKAATSTIPIVFQTGGDPVKLGLVASLSRPGGNLTGVTTLASELGPKRLELVHELLPTATVIPLLVNPTNLTNVEISTRELEIAAKTIGLKLFVLHASTERDFDAVFATLVQMRARALLVVNEAFFNSQSEQIAALSLRHAVPAIYMFREFAEAGGLMSYGGSLTDNYRQVGDYAGRILKGEKPADLPVQQATKVELIINLKTAKALGITVPLSLLGRADEVIE